MNSMPVAMITDAISMIVPPNREILPTNTEVFNPGRGLESLPEELLDNICSFLPQPNTFYPNPIGAINIVSKKFHRISEPYLYHHVHSLGGENSVKLVQRRRKHPHLAEMVKTLSVDPRRAPHWPTPSKARRARFIEGHRSRLGVIPLERPLSDEEQLLVLLSLLPLLEVLDIRDFCREWRNCHRGSAWVRTLRAVSLSQLREVTLDLTNLQTSELEVFLSLPSLRVLSIFGPSNPVEHPKSGLSLPFPIMTSSVQQISITDLSGRAQEKIIHGCKSLRSFSIHYARHHSSEPFMGLAARLESQKHSLEELEITASDDWHMYRTRFLMEPGFEPVLGLQAFTSLRYLRADYTALVGHVLPLNTTDNHAPLWQALPVGLRVLRVDLTVLGPNEKLETFCADLTTLAATCKKHFPNLKAVTVATDLLESSELLDAPMIPFSEAEVEYVQLWKQRRYDTPRTVFRGIQ